MTTRTPVWAPLAVALAALSSGCIDTRTAPRDAGAALVRELAPTTSAHAQSPPHATAPARPTDPAPAVIRGIYVNAYAAGNPITRTRLLALTDTTELNTWVVDVKDEDGVRYPSALPLAVEATHVRSIPIRDLRALADTLRAHGIHPIARIVVFKDSVTARVHPEWTIRRTDNSIWRDKKGLAWVNPYHRELWDYNIGVAEELVSKYGFDEIQWDYIRFPEPYKSLPQQVFPGSNGMSKPDALAAYLKTAKERLNKLGVRSTADIFGLVTTV